MEVSEIIIYLCIVLPIAPIMLAMRDKHYKRFILFMTLGFTICLVSSQINTLLIDYLNMDVLRYSTAISPIIEELLKAIPIIYFAIFYAEKDDEILPLAFAIGIGFAILESVVIYCDNMDYATISWAIIRGFGASLMHSVCTAMIAMGINYVINKKGNLFKGIVGLFALAIIYHGIFNAFVQSKFSFIALLLPLLLFIPINIIEYKKKKYFEK